MGLLETIKLLASLLPLIHQVVLLVEQIFPKAGSGAQKLEVAVGIIQSAMPTIGASAEQISAIGTTLRPVVSGVVSALNVAGAPSSPAQPAASDTPASG